MNFTDVKVKHRYIIENFDIENTFMRKRYYDYGIYPGKIIEVIEKSLPTLKIRIDGVKREIDISFFSHVGLSEYGSC